MKAINQIHVNNAKSMTLGRVDILMTIHKLEGANLFVEGQNVSPFLSFASFKYDDTNL